MRTSTIDRVTSHTAIQGVLAGGTLVAGLAFWRALGDPFSLLKLTILVLTAILGLALAALGVRRRRDLALPPAAVSLAVGCFLAALLLAVVTSERPWVSFVGAYGVDAGFLTYAVGIVLLLLAVMTFDEGGAARLLRWASAALVVVAGYAVLQRLGVDAFDWHRETVVISTLGNSNFAAGWLATTTPLALGLLLLEDGRRRWLGAVAFVGGLVAIAATGSFLGVPGVVAGIGVTLVLLGQGGPLGAVYAAARADRRIGAAVAAVAAVLAAVAVLVVVRTPGAIDDGLLERRYFWSAAWRSFRAHPIFGTGLDTFGNHFFPLRSAEHALRYGSSSAEAPHSVPLAMLTGGGIILGLAYLALIVVVGSRLYLGTARAAGTTRILGAALSGAFAAYFVQSLVSIDVPAVAVLPWLIGGVGLAVVAPQDRLVLARPVPASSRRSAQPALHPVGPALIGIVVVLSLVGTWLAIRPLRADREAAGAVGQAKRTGSPAEVLRTLDRATDLAPWESTYQLAKASFFAAVSNRPLAARAAARAAELAPGRPTADLIAADQFAASDQRDEAATWYRRALRDDPESPDTASRAIQGLLSVGAYRKALPLIERRVEADPKVSGNQVALARAELGLHRLGPAQAALERAEELGHPTAELARLWLAVAVAQREAGDPRAAATSLDRALGLDADLYEAVVAERRELRSAP